MDYRDSSLVVGIGGSYKSRTRGLVIDGEVVCVSMRGDSRVEARYVGMVLIMTTECADHYSLPIDHYSLLINTDHYALPIDHC